MTSKVEVPVGRVDVSDYTIPTDLSRPRLGLEFERADAARYAV